MKPERTAAGACRSVFAVLKVVILEAGTGETMGLTINY